MRISDWSSDVCSSDLMLLHLANPTTTPRRHGSERVQQERKEELAGRLVAKGQVSRAYTALPSKAQLATSASTKTMLASKHTTRTRKISEDVLTQPSQRKRGNEEREVRSPSSRRPAPPKTHPR